MQLGRWPSRRRMGLGWNMDKPSKFSEKDEKIYARISPALDRFQEAHFWIHGMENAYHSAEIFRWHLNVFLKAIKEIPNLISMALQNDEGFNEWFKSCKLILLKIVMWRWTDTFGMLRKKRTFLVFYLRMMIHCLVSNEHGRFLNLKRSLLICARQLGPKLGKH